MWKERGLGKWYEIGNFIEVYILVYGLVIFKNVFFSLVSYSWE